MIASILYAGDGHLRAGASYLAGVLTHFNLPFDYVDSETAIGPALRGGRRQLYILSDYPGDLFRPEDYGVLLDAVRAGSGLLMIGGWDSFQGRAGHYAGTPLEAALPVVLERQDDRVNCAQPWVVFKKAAHPIVEGLPFDRPSSVGGYNRVTPRPGATTVLTARQLVIRADDADVRVTSGAEAPLLVTGQFGKGRTAAFATDLAPHWVGMLVDWGERRVRAQAPGSHQVEVGNDYAELCHRMVRWTMGEL